MAILLMLGSRDYLNRPAVDSPLIVTYGAVANCYKAGV
jgi:hypothetical protein